MRYRIKSIIVMIFMIFTLPFSLYAMAQYKLFKSERAYSFFAQLFSLVPGLLGQYLRTSYYKVTLQSCAYDLSVGLGSFFSHPTASVGKGVVITVYSIIGTATIGDNVLVSARVSILSGKYQHGGGIRDNTDQNADDQQGIELKRVSIGKNTWIGENSIVMCSIENDCVVSAGSVVTKPMKSNQIAVGNPARFLKRDYNVKKN